MSIVRLVRRGPSTLGIGVLSMLVAHCATYQLLAAAAPTGSTRAAGVSDATAQLAAAHLAAGHDAVAAALLAGADGGVVHAGHAHVLPMASSAFLVALLGALGCLVALGRRRTVTVPRVSTLIGVQLVAFAALEVFDRVAAGAGPSSAVADARVWAALAAQPIVAWLVFGLMRRAVAAVAEWFSASSPRFVTSTAALWSRVARSVRPLVQIVNPGAPRGPPSVRSIPI